MSDTITACAARLALVDRDVTQVRCSVIDDSCSLDGHAPQMLDELQRCLIGDFDVEHSTFQLEPVSDAGHETGVHL